MPTLLIWEPTTDLPGTRARDMATQLANVAGFY